RNGSFKPQYPRLDRTTAGLCVVVPHEQNCAFHVINGICRACDGIAVPISTGNPRTYHLWTALDGYCARQCGSQCNSVARVPLQNNSLDFRAESFSNSCPCGGDIVHQNSCRISGKRLNRQKQAQKQQKINHLKALLTRLPWFVRFLRLKSSLTLSILSLNFPS